MLVIYLLLLLLTICDYSIVITIVIPGHMYFDISCLEKWHIPYAYVPVNFVIDKIDLCFFFI